MRQGLKDAWVAALRGGAYRQTEGSLKDRDGFCCLGVLCQVIDPVREPLVHINARYPQRTEGGLPLTFDDEELPPEMLADVGLEKTAMDVLVRLNDGAIEDQESGRRAEPSQRFDAIADWIEANVPATPGDAT